MAILFAAGLLVIAVLVYLIFFNNSKPPSPDSPPPECLSDPYWGNHKYMTLPTSNLKMHYVEKGDEEKPLMLFLHGFPEFWYSWRYQLYRHSDKFWCVAPDLRGYGDSDKPNGVGNYALGKLVEDVRDLIQGLGRSECILVAHDWGGMLGYAFCAQYPSMVKMYVAVNTVNISAPYLNTWQQKLKMMLLAPFLLPYLPEWFLTRRGAKQFFAEMYKTAFHLHPGTAEQDLAAYSYAFRESHTWTCALNYYRALATHADQEILKKMASIRVPVRCIFGTEDKNLSVEMAQSCRDVCEDFDIVLLDGVSHFSQSEAPERVSTHIHKFVTGEEYLM